jgi:hypothetical protein
LEVKISVNEDGIREVGLEELVFAARRISPQEPNVFFGETNGKKILFVSGWIVDSEISQGEHLICSTAIETLFSIVEAFKKFLVYHPLTRKVEYKDDLLDLPTMAVCLPVVKVFSIREEKVLSKIGGRFQ